MSVKEIVPGLYAIPLGVVNAFLVDSDGLTLVDTGVPGSAGKILKAVQAIGRQPADIKHILVTHWHSDHAGSLAALQQQTGAPATMHPVDAALVRQGGGPLDLNPAPGLINQLLFRLFIGTGESRYDPAEIDHEVQDSDELPLAGGIRAIHVPGHCAGQLAFLWEQHGGVLFAADTASNMVRLGYSLGYQDFKEGQRSLARLAALDFEIAGFGHGKTITRGASARFRQKWGTP
jgi:glyoxylase-like metal-dependent hydrolase (beta-lactamase superfamily II)